MNISCLRLLVIMFFALSGLSACSGDRSVQTKDSKESVVVGFKQVDLDLFTAVRNGDAVSMQKLIDKGADANKRRRPWNMTPLLLASDKPVAVAKALVKADADVNVADRDGATVLMKAVQAGNIEVAKLLLENGAKTEVRDNFNETALVYAVVLGRAEIVEMLIKHGADVNVVRYNGETPLILAKRNAQYARDSKVPLIMRHESGLDGNHDDHHAPTFITKEQLTQERTDIVALMQQAGAKEMTVTVDHAKKSHH